MIPEEVIADIEEFAETGKSGCLVPVIDDAPEGGEGEVDE